MYHVPRKFLNFCVFCKKRGKAGWICKINKLGAFAYLRWELENTILNGFHKMKESIKKFSVMNTKLQTNKNPMMIMIMMSFT